MLGARSSRACFSSPTAAASLATLHSGATSACSSAIGRGAFGEVYRAWDTRLDREVALKLLPDTVPRATAGATIIEEGRLLARVRHPNVVTIYGAERIGDRIGLWMEFVEGTDAQQLLEQGRRLQRQRSSRSASSCAARWRPCTPPGCCIATSRPHNVMLADDGRVVLMDFGTGRELDDRRPDLAGTPLYLAPEVLAGREPLASRATSTASACCSTTC